MFLFSFLIISTFCEGQEKANAYKVPINSKKGPAVIRNFRTAAWGQDFDTTLVSQYIRSIFQDTKGNLWFGTIGDGAVRYDGETLTYLSDPDGFISTSVFAINEDRKGNLWFGTSKGVCKYDGKSFRNYSLKDGLSHIDISRKGILVDRFGTIWVGTHGGVYRYDPLADKEGRQCFSRFSLLPSINVAGIMEDRKGNIWFASSDKGAFCYDGKVVVNFNEKEGLSRNYAGGIAEDNEGNIWFTMKNGISKFDGKKFTDYTPKDGLGGNEFWGIIIEQSGIVWITARGSTTRFDPSVPLSDPNAFRVFTSADGFTCCVQTMFQDRSGNMWWGTGQGLYRFNGSRFYQVKKIGPW